MTETKKLAIVVLAFCTFAYPVLGQDIFEAVQKGELTIIERLLQSTPSLVSERNTKYDTPLHIAADAGHLEIVQLLIKSGAEVNSVNSFRRTPVLMAGYKGFTDVVKVLLKSGASLDYVDDRGYTPLRWAAVRGKKEVVELYVAMGAEISIHEAAACGHFAFIDKKLEEGSDINGINQDGRTPLHQSVYSGNVETIAYLIQKGSDVNAKSSNNETPLDLAIEQDRKEIAALLRSHGAYESPMMNPDLVHVSKNIYRMTFPYEMHSNIGISSGPDGFLVVDTGFSLRAVQKIKSTLDSLGKGEIKFIINTHPHWDHIAAHSIGDKSTVYIGFDKLLERVTDGVLSRGDVSLRGKTGRSFDLYYTTHFNGEEIRLIPYPGVHSSGDILVHFVESGVVQMGDLLLSQSFPAVGTGVRDYLTFLEIVLDIFTKDTQFISGHGHELTWEGVRDYYNMLLETIQIVREGMNDDKSIEDLQRERVLKEYESYGKLLEFLNADNWIAEVFRCYREQ